MGSFIPLPENEDLAALRAKIVRVQEERLAVAERIIQTGGSIDNTTLLMLRLNTLIDLIVPSAPDELGQETNLDRLRLELDYEERVLEICKQAIAMVNRARLAGGNGGLVIP